MEPGPTLWGFERDLHALLDDFVDQVRCQGAAWVYGCLCRPARRAAIWRREAHCRLLLRCAAPPLVHLAAASPLHPPAGGGARRAADAGDLQGAVGVAQLLVRPPGERACSGRDGSTFGEVASSKQAQQLSAAAGTLPLK